MKTQCAIIVLCAVLSLTPLASLAQSDTNKTATASDASIVSEEFLNVVKDDAIIKAWAFPRLYLLKDVSNLVKAAKNIASKYGVNLDNAKAFWGSDVSVRMDAERNGVSYGFSKDWSRQIGVLNPGRMPHLEYRNGGVTIYLSDLSVHYKDGTECRMGDKSYCFVNGKWSIEP